MEQIMETKQNHIGIIGLGVMGLNLAQNISNQNFRVAGFEKDPALIEAARSIATNIDIFDDIIAFIASIEKPKKILLMITAGEPVDEVINYLQEYLSSGDVIIDGGNSHYKDSLSRQQQLLNLDIHYISLGISGGANGARYGPAIMAGGSVNCYKTIEPILRKVAAKTDNKEICASHLGDSAAIGHFVKMIHNGIEYADMQIIAETYDFLSKGMGYSELESAKIFKEWSSSELSSFLIDISVSVLEYLDRDTEQPLVSLILDRAEQKGTGRLAAIAALELGVAAPSISEAVSARILSSKKQERVSSSQIYKKPEPKPAYLDIVDMKKALLAAKISAYAQGFDILSAANKEFDWDMNLADIAKIWRAGCIIRARFLDEVADAFTTETKLVNLIMAPHFSSILKDSIPSLRRTVKWAITRGIPSPVLSASLSYFETYTSLNLPANLIQGQRDYFGSHGFERIDKPGYYTDNWNQ